jgi:trk system potassium uptake protein
MPFKGNIVVAGHSSFSWALVEQLAPAIRGRLYFVLSDHDQATEASLEANVIAVHGQITDTGVLDQLDLPHCSAFIASSREDEPNILAALYAKQHGAERSFARVFNVEFMPLVSSLGVMPLQTSHTAAAYTALSLLKPSVSELVQLSSAGGRFVLEEIEAADYPELVGCRLGDLHAEHLHIIAVAQGGDVRLGYATVVNYDATLIVMCDRQIMSRLRQEMREVAAYAAQHPSGGSQA